MFRDVAALGRFLDAAQPGRAVGDRPPGARTSAPSGRTAGCRHWLTGRFGRRVRSRDAGYLGAVEQWFTQLLPQVVERQIDRGGPVIMVQVENEYGSYGTDAVYLRRLADMLGEQGVSVPLFTSDGPEDHMLTRRSGARSARHGQLRVRGA